MNSLLWVCAALALADPQPEAQGVQGGQGYNPGVSGGQGYNPGGGGGQGYNPGNEGGQGYNPGGDGGQGYNPGGQQGYNPGINYLPLDLNQEGYNPGSSISSPWTPVSTLGVQTSSHWTQSNKVAAPECLTPMHVPWAHLHKGASLASAGWWTSVAGWLNRAAAWRASSATPTTPRSVRAWTRLSATNGCVISAMRQPCLIAKFEEIQAI